MINMYRHAVQAGFYCDEVECSLVTQAARVRSEATALMIKIFHLLHLAPTEFS